jgi:hypothetical protein
MLKRLTAADTEESIRMSAFAAALPLPAPRVWVAPTLTEHGPLAALAHAAAGTVPAVAALLQITISCIQSPPSCHL